MPYSRDCEACSVSVHLTPEEIKELFGKTVRVKSVKTVSEEEFTRRIEICKACEHFIYGTTCRQCGCVIQIKAKLTGAKCPNPYYDKWNG